MLGAYSIRAMEVIDIQKALTIVVHSFGSKMPAMNGFTVGQMADFLRVAGVFDQQQLANHYVAIVDQQVVGVMHLETLKAKHQKNRSSIDFMYLFRQFGVIRVILSAVSLLFLEDKLAGDEMLVDFIAIDSPFRGKGIGSALLDYGETVARKTEGITRYTLSVIEDNKGARRLYERKGFCLYKTTSSRLMKLFTGIRTSHKLEKQL